MKELLKIWNLEVKRHLPVGMAMMLTYFILNLAVCFLQFGAGRTPLDGNFLLILIIKTGAYLTLIGTLISVFFIWYRDWWGQARFITRWLSTPITKGNVYLAKHLTLIYYTLWMVGITFMCFILAWLLLKLNLVTMTSEIQPIHLVLQSAGELGFFYSSNPVNTVIIYLFWFSLLPIVSNLILVERIYGLRYSLIPLVIDFILFYMLTQFINWGWVNNSRSYDWLTMVYVIVIGAVQALIGYQLFHKHAHLK